MNKCIIALVCLICVPAYSQRKFIDSVIRPDSTLPVIQDKAYQYAQSIKSPHLREIIEYLASDSCEGRELGTKGIERAADYIYQLFEKKGIQKLSNNSYYQHVDFSWINWDKLHFKIRGVAYKQLWDYLILPVENKDLQFKTNEILFLGYGIDDENYSDYLNVNVKDKVILIYKGEPKNKEGIFYTTGSSIPSLWSMDLDLKIQTASRHGAKMVLIIEDKFKEFVDANRQYVISPTVVVKDESADTSFRSNSMHLSSTTVTQLLSKQIRSVIKARDKINRSGKPQSLVIKTELEFLQKRQTRHVEGKNILAYIEGSDKKDELILLTAHYDHIGKRAEEVFNGADDNASGSAAVIEIAATLQQLKNSGKGPRRSVLCMLLTGEEKGLLGSLYYVNNPVFPLEKSIANINVDMIGRTDDKYKQDSNYIYVIGSDRISTDLHYINLDVNQRYSQLKLDHTYNSESDPNRFYFRSDHYNFAEAGIPAIFFFSGVHEDYHRITDDPHKILYGKTEKIARHIFLLTWELANLDFKLNLNP